jgi:hypothetical protein
MQSCIESAFYSLRTLQWVEKTFRGGGGRAVGMYVKPLAVEIGQFPSAFLRGE